MALPMQAVLVVPVLAGLAVPLLSWQCCPCWPVLIELPMLAGLAGLAGLAVPVLSWPC